jgi:uncharacterized protein (PEP-CTERM system associated)
VGGIISVVRFHRRVGRRLIWSYLVIGSVAWSGSILPSNAAEVVDETAARPLRAYAGGDPALPGARAPGVENPTAPRGGWTFNATAGSDFTFTDNVFLTDTNRSSDFIVTPRAGVSARRTTARTVLNAEADLAYDYYTQHTRLNGARPSALVDGFVNVVEDIFTIDGRLATDVQQITDEERRPATERNLAENQTQILNYGVTPTLHGRFGGDVEAEASYDFSAVNFLDPPVGVNTVAASDTVRHVGRGQIGRNNTSARLAWSIGGYYERAEIEGLAFQSERKNVEGRAEYRVSGPWALVARGGYDWIDEPTLVLQPDGAYGLVGAIWRPSRRTHARLEVGHRYGDFNAEGEVVYQANQALILSASYTRDVQTGQRILLTNLGGLARDEFGSLIDPVTGLPPNPNNAAFGLTNQAFKRDLFRVGMHGTAGRTFYTLSGEYEHRAANGLGGESWGAQGVLGRDITPRLQASLTASHAKTTGDPGLAFAIRDSKTTTGGARLDYALTRTVRTSLRYVHMRRNTTVVRYRENALVLGLSKVF